MLYGMIKNKINLCLFKRKWRKKNISNKTSAGNNIFNINLVDVGKQTYGRLNILTYNDRNKVIIGDYCSIGPKVCFIPSADHYLNNISTFPYRVMVLNHSLEGVSKGDIIVDDDVWIGYGAIILSGVHIGQGAVIAAGTVVAHDVEPYAIVGGVPAKIIKYRFSQEIRDYMLTLDYKKLDEELICSHVDDFYKPVDDMELEEVKELYNWFPKRMSN